MTGNGRWRAEGLGESGETYLVGPDRLMRSDSRFLMESPDRYFEQLRRLRYPRERIEQIQARGTTVLTQQVETPAVERAIAGQAATGHITDYRGIDVLSSFTPLEIPDLEWVLLSEIDSDEAFGPIITLRNRLLALALAISAGFLALGYVFSNRITEPLIELTRAVERLGDREWRVVGGLKSFEKADDEVARLAQQFDAVSRRLQDSTVSRDYLDALLGSMINAVLTIGPVNRSLPGGPILIRSANPAASALLGYASGELIGQPIARFLGGGSSTPAWLEALRRDGRPYDSGAVHRRVCGVAAARRRGGLRRPGHHRAKGGRKATAGAGSPPVGGAGRRARPTGARVA